MDESVEQGGEQTIEPTSQVEEAGEGIGEDEQVHDQDEQQITESYVEQEQTVEVTEEPMQELDEDFDFWNQ